MSRQIRLSGLALASLTLAGFSLAALTATAVRAEGDAAAGEKVFLKCRACHQVGETAKNAVGPKLNGLFGRKAGTIEGFSYSDANKNSGITWDEATFREYIKDPKAKIPGTKMVFVGLKVDREIDDVIAYLKQFGPDGKKVQ
ncbi:cytochrome c family protein [Chelatococcus sp. SYSU_G07232]|uniref:Cytochrome c family protein n=1 Tax=Chelatococcus albus TaxID=3047466 RepID=A0ABT7ACG2_9HYPH|nr:cytochrome c family protein [Chelatococcus sp. SYSU_G07232]MDJ1157051.1 cytochrome c family protein [Chelatococcus sp. SYSU_G07232]